MYNLFCNKKIVVLNLTFEMLVACGAFVALRHTYFFQGILERTIRLLKSLLTLKFADYKWKVKREETLQKIHEMEQTLKE